MITKFTDPFDHYLLDDFLDEDHALKLSQDFIPYDSLHWYVYNNPLEVKHACNNWYHFPPTTYQFFHYLNSEKFVEYIQEITSESKIFIDMGLHGAGWHMHGTGGKLNVHLDYSLHPKTELLRKFNLIYYLTPNWDPSWGGGLEIWSHDSENNKPKEKIKIIDCKFNRAVLFDASKNSWHGFNDPITCPEGVYRKSIAVYYHTVAPANIDPRTRVLFAPSKEQENDPEILELIKQRSR